MFNGKSRYSGLSVIRISCQKGDTFQDEAEAKEECEQAANALIGELGDPVVYRIQRLSRTMESVRECMQNELKEILDNPDRPWIMVWEPYMPETSDGEFQPRPYWVLIYDVKHCPEAGIRTILGLKYPERINLQDGVHILEDEDETFFLKAVQ